MSCGKQQELAGHALLQPVDTGDTVTNADHGAGFGQLHLTIKAFNLPLDNLTNLCCGNLCHDASPPYELLAQPRKLALQTAIENDVTNTDD